MGARRSRARAHEVTGCGYTVVTQGGHRAHLGGEEQRGEDEGPPRARVEQRALGARLHPVHVDQRDHQRLRREPGALPDVLEEGEDGARVGRLVRERRRGRRRQLGQREERGSHRRDVREWHRQRVPLLGLGLRVRVLAEKRQHHLVALGRLVVADPAAQHGRHRADELAVVGFDASRYRCCDQLGRSRPPAPQLCGR